MTTLRDQIAELIGLAAADDALEVVQPALAAKDAEIERLRGLLDELRRRPDSWCSHQHITMTRFAEVIVEKLNAVGQRDEATKYARQMIAERDQAEATLERVRELRDKWLRWPGDDPHHAAGLMLSRHLDPPQEKP